MSDRKLAIWISLTLCAQSLDAAADNFPGLQVTARTWGPLATDQGYDQTARLYGAVDLYVDGYDSGERSGMRLSGGGVVTNKIGLFARTSLTDDLSILVDVEEGFNVDGDALSRNNSTWQDIGRLRLAMIGLRSKTWGKLDIGKTYGVTGPLMLDPFYGPARLSPYTSLGAPPATRGAYYIEPRPKHSVVYYTPRWHGWGLSTAATFNFDAAASSGRSVRGSGFRVDYMDSRHLVMGGYSRYWSDPYETPTASNKQTPNDLYFASYSYDFGPLSTSLSWQRQAVRTDIAPDLNLYTVGALIPSGKNFYRTVLVYRSLGGKSNDAWGFMAGAEHFFTPSTALYVRAGFVVNQPAAAQTLAAIPMEEADDTPRILAVGMYHTF